MKNILSLLLVLTTIHSISQSTFTCGTEEEGPALIYSQTRLNQAKFITTEENYVFDIKFHFVADDDGDYGFWGPFNEEEMEHNSLEMIGRLNMIFNHQHIFFKYIGYDSLNNSLLSDLNLDEPFADSYLPYTNLNRIDIFLNNSISKSGNPIAGLCHKRRIDDILVFENIFLTYENQPIGTRYEKLTLPHELGHYFSLYHTHQLWYDNAGSLEAFGDNEYLTSCDFFEENLNGDDAYYLGDFLADTSPDRVKSMYDFGIDETCSITTSSYHSVCDGVNDIDFDLFNPPTQNTMSYYGNCREYFSGEQFLRMRAFIHDYSQPGNLFHNNMGTIASLYEPFKIVFDENCEYNNSEYDTEIMSYNDNEPEIKLDSGLTYRAIDPNLPRKGCYVPYFQPGFDYEVYRCHPTDYYGDSEIDELLFTYDIDIEDSSIFTIPKFNYWYRQIKILQLEDEISYCRDPWLEAAIGGSIYSHDEGADNIQVLDSTNINSINLLHNLPNGIHTINIETNKGETLQKTILKNDD